MAKGYRRGRNPKKILPQSAASADATLIDLGDVKHQAEDFFERHKIIILSVFAAVVSLLGIYLGYKYLYMEPRNKEALEQMYQAEFMYGKDSFDLALNNPGGGFPGFREIADTYGGTPAGNLAKYYAGMCNLYLKNYEEAKSYLEDFNAKGEIMPILKYGALGDVLSELNEREQAAKSYLKAINAGDNNFLTPMYLKRYGVLKEAMGDKESALKAYKRIEMEYSDSPDAIGIEKYILPLE